MTLHKFDIISASIRRFWPWSFRPALRPKDERGALFTCDRVILSGSESLEAAQVPRWCWLSDGLGGNRFVSYQTTLLQWEDTVTYASLSLLHLLLSLLPPIPRSQTLQLAPAPCFESVYAFLHYYHQTVCQHVFRNNLL